MQVEGVAIPMVRSVHRTNAPAKTMIFHRGRTRRKFYLAWFDVWKGLIEGFLERTAAGFALEKSSANFFFAVDVFRGLGGR